MSSPQLTPEQLARLPHDDKGGALLAAHWVLTALAATFLGLRVYCKRITNRRLLMDDWILIASLLTILVTDGLTTALVEQFGLGRHSWDLKKTNDLSKMIILLSVRVTFTMTSMAWTKTAFAVTLLRLTAGWTRSFVWFIIISLNVTTIVSASIPWIRCKPLAKTWDRALPGTCWAPMVGTKIYISMGAYSALMDFTLAALPWIYLYRTLLRKKEMLGVLIAMSMGAVAGGVAIAKCVHIPDLRSGDSYDAIQLFIWDITESTVTVMAACIPNFRVLLVRGTASPRYYQFSNISFSVREITSKNTEAAHNVTELRGSSK